MYIAYSAFRPEEKDQNNNDVLARYQGYQVACQKHNQTIAAIQKYIPGWQPAFYQTLNTK